MNAYRDPGYLDKGISTVVFRVLCNNLTEFIGVLHAGMNAVRSSSKFVARVQKSCITHKGSGYCVTGVQNSHKFQAGILMIYP